MKKLVVLLAIAVIAAPALAMDGNNTPTTSTLQNTAGGTTSTSTGTWVTSPFPPGSSSSSAPFTGTIVDNSPGLHWYKTELAGAQSGATYNLDTAYGTGVMGSYTSPDGLQTVNTYNSLGKLSPKTGTFNVSANIWADKMQAGTVARTTSSSGYAGKTVLNIGTGGAVRITGTEASGTAGNNFMFAYGSNIDASVKVSGTGVLSGITRSGDPLTGTVVGGRTIEFGRSGTSYTGNKIDFELNGSQATVEAWSLKMNGNVNATTGTDETIRYVTDAGGNSAINLYGNGSLAVAVGINSKIDFVLGAAATEGQVFTLINLVDSTASINTAAGKFKTMWGTNINEGGTYDYWFNGVMYGLQASYVGGTGNDLTFTVVPEPATLALLSLGGLVLARRRRA